jgi:hypothetical protein
MNLATSLGVESYVVVGTIAGLNAAASFRNNTWTRATLGSGSRTGPS